MNVFGAVLKPSKAIGGDKRVGKPLGAFRLDHRDTRWKPASEHVVHVQPVRRVQTVCHVSYSTPCRRAELSSRNWRDCRYMSNYSTRRKAPSGSASSRPLVPQRPPPSRHRSESPIIISQAPTVGCGSGSCSCTLIVGVLSSGHIRYEVRE